MNTSVLVHSIVTCPCIVFRLGLQALIIICMRTSILAAYVRGVRKENVLRYNVFIVRDGVR